MSRSLSRLAYLMDALDISGRELARAISVDYSLVSKWRTRNRVLTKRSAHVRKIAEHLLHADRPAGYRRLSRIVEGISEAELADEKKLLDLLTAWLVTDGSIAPIDILFTPLGRQDPARTTVDCVVCRGNAPRRTAVLQFMDFALTLPEGRAIYLVSQEDTAWMTEDPAFLSVWQQKLATIIAHNHQITIIHWIDRDSEQVGPMLAKWLPLHLTGRISAWYYPKYSEPIIRSTLFLIEDQLVLTGMDEGENAHGRYTALFRDANSLRHYRAVFAELLRNCQPLVTSCEMPECVKLMDQLRESFSGHQSLFLASRLFQIATLQEDAFDRLLGSLPGDHESSARLQSFYRSASPNFSIRSKRFRTRHLYDLDQLAKAAAGEIPPFPGPGVPASSDNLVSREVFRQHALHLAKAVEENDDFEIALINFNRLPMITTANILIEKSNYVIAWDPSIGNRLVTSSEPTTVNAFYHFYDKLWDAIPRTNRSKEFVINELKKLTRL